MFMFVFTYCDEASGDFPYNVVFCFVLLEMGHGFGTEHISQHLGFFGRSCKF